MNQKKAEEQAFGPFQRKARNLGIEHAIVRRLPRGWPHCYGECEPIEDALYEAGYPSGEALLQTAKQLWQYRPSYLRPSKI